MRPMFSRVDVTTGDLIELGGSKRKRKRPGAKVVTDEQEKQKAEKEEARQAKVEAHQEEVEAWKARQAAVQCDGLGL